MSPLPSIAPDDSKRSKYLNIVLNNKTGSLVLRSKKDRKQHEIAHLTFRYSSLKKALCTIKNLKSNGKSSKDLSKGAEGLIPFWLENYLIKPDFTINVAPKPCILRRPKNTD